MEAVPVIAHDELPVKDKAHLFNALELRSTALAVVLALAKEMVPGVVAVTLVVSNVIPSPMVNVFELREIFVANWFPNQRTE